MIGVNNIYTHFDVMLLNTGSFPLELYFYDPFSHSKVQQLAVEIVVTSSEQNTCQSNYFNVEQLYWNEQWIMVFVVQEVFYYFLIIHSYITMQTHHNN